MLYMEESAKGRRDEFDDEDGEDPMLMAVP